MSVASIKSVTVKCPKTKKCAEVIFKPDNIYTKSTPCNFCGSHGKLHYTYTCPSCAKEHSAIIYDW